MYNETGHGLLALLQLADSAFPSGGFAHSSGLEQLVRDGRVCTATDVERFVASLIRHSIATSDASAAAIAARGIARGDADEIRRADHAIFAMKAPSELRIASTAMGARLLQETTAHVDAPALHALTSDIRAAHTPGTHPVAFGAAAGVMRVSPAHAAAAFMLSAANSLLQASMRLMPVSHRDVQGALHRMRPQIAALAQQSAGASVSDLCSFNPLQEIASMRHRPATVRLFAS